MQLMRLKPFLSIFLFTVTCFFSSETKAQIDFSPTKSDTASTYSVVMKDGSVLNGTIVSRTQNEIVFKDVNLGTIIIKTNKIKSIDRISNKSYVLVTMKSGSKVVGELISTNDSTIVVESETLGKVTVSLRTVKEMRLIDKSNMKNGIYRTANHLGFKYYFFGPSAILPKQDECYLQSTYVLFDKVDYGYTKHFSIGGGALAFIVPFASIKAGVEIFKNFHLGAGAYLVVSPFVKQIGLPSAVYATATIGNREKNISLGVALGWMKDFALQKPVYTLCGQIRFGRKTAFVSENYFIPIREDSYNTVISYAQSTYSYYYEMVFSYGIRLLADKNNWDFGFIGTSGLFGEIPLGIPFVSYHRKF